MSFPIPKLQGLLLPITLVLSGSLGMAVADESAQADQVELLMFEQAGCIYCRRWDAEVAKAYPLTEEGRAAPLRRIDIHDPLPGDVSLDSPPILTPTFVLARDGAEITRIEGYAGEDFFWPMLDAMLTDAGISTAEIPDADRSDPSP